MYLTPMAGPLYDLHTQVLPDGSTSFWFPTGDGNDLSFYPSVDPDVIAHAATLTSAFGNLVGSGNLARTDTTTSFARSARTQVIIRDNPLLGLRRVGSANKIDGQHGFSDLVDGYARYGQRFLIDTMGPNGKFSHKSELVQLLGADRRGVSGVYEWIIDKGAVTHRRFIPNGEITGTANQIPK